MATLTEIAIWHAERGFSVAPIHNKRALTRWGEKHSEHSKDPQWIREHFSRKYTYRDRVSLNYITTPPTGIGLILSASSTVVLDLDSEAAVKWAREMAKLDPSPYRSAPQICSPRDGGGLHLYFRQNPARDALRQCHGGISEGVDIKAKGSLVVAAGSLHKTGRRYFIKRGKENMSAAELPLAPDHLYDWQKTQQAPVTDWTQNNHSGFEGTILYHLVKIYSGNDQKLHIRCPNYMNHTNRDTSGTVLYPANKLGGMGKIHCEHASCSGMRLRDWKQAVGEQQCNEVEKRILSGS